MKMYKKIFLTLVFSFFLVCLGSCVIEEGHVHIYGEWTIIDQPSETGVGLARRLCRCNYYEDKRLPILVDETVWTLEVDEKPTCLAEGSKTYTSEYGNVTISVAVLEHPYGEWTIVTEPTLTVVGEAKHECGVCHHEEVVDIEPLSDKDVWTEEVVSAPTYLAKGSSTYTSEYGEITIETDKLVAPYDNKTYYSIGIDVEENDINYRNGVASVETAWLNAFVALDENGIGQGSGYPFSRGQIQFKIVDSATGEMEFIATPIDDTNPEEPVLVIDEATTYSAYVDMNTGIVIRPYRSLFNSVHLMVPSGEAIESSSVSASSWDNAIAIAYTDSNETHYIFVYKSKVYFDVSFVNANSVKVEVDECYNSSSLYVEDSEGNLIAGFAYNSEISKLVETDGLEGTYTGDSGNLVISGFGTVELAGVSGTYTKASPDAMYTIAAYINNSYYEITLGENHQYVCEQPSVKISFVAGEYATIQAIEINKNIPYQLPIPTHELQAFIGWYYDEACQQPVEENFVPTKDVTLHGLWKAKVVVNLVGVLENDPIVLYLAEGDAIGSALPKYAVNLDIYKVFRGWYLDPEFSTSLPEEAKITVNDSNVTIYAKWEDLPAYYGTYYGTELYNAGYGNFSKRQLVIDENNNLAFYEISSTGGRTLKKSGVVTAYDPSTQKVTWTSATNQAIDSFYYDDVTGIVAGLYSSNVIGNDYYLMNKNHEEYRVNANFGVKAPREPGSSTSGWYAQFVNTLTKDGVKDLFLYNNYIYSNVLITDALGNELTIGQIKNYKTVVVRDAETKNVIIGVGSIGKSFDDNSTTTLLDQHFGTYTIAQEVVTLDGMGTITYGEKSGTYTYVEATKEFDVYLENNSEYYQLELFGTTCTLSMILVKITFEVGDGHTAINSRLYNANVVAKLPDVTEANYVFNGWFFDPLFENAVPTVFIPTVNITLYAKYSLPAVLSIYYNSDAVDEQITYSVGDTATVPTPVYAKHVFEGWYTTSNFEVGTEWSAGGAILSDVSIYAKWSVAPLYCNVYLATEIKGNNVNGGESSKYTWSSAKLDISPYGTATCTAYPFRGTVTIENYDQATGTFEFKLVNSSSSSTTTTIYQGFLDNSGIIVLIVDVDEVLLLSPFETTNFTSKISSSYWNAGQTRVIEYTNEGSTYQMFINNSTVYFGVSVEDASNNPISCGSCYSYDDSNVYIYDANGRLIAKYGHDGQTLQPLDGYEGTYTDAKDNELKLVIDGIKNLTLGAVAGTYTVAEADSEYTLDAYINGVYYEITLNVSNKSFSTLVPKVIITFDAGTYAVVNEVEANKNIAIQLSVPTHENYIFRGWFLDTEFTEKVDNNYIPTSTLTLYGKWDLKVTLTVVYGNGVEDAVLEYGSGDSATPVTPDFTNNKVFDGWYLDAELTEVYTPSVITADTTIFCKWKEAIALYGTYSGTEVWGTTLKGGISSGGTSSYKLQIDADGNVTGQRTGTIIDYNPETGNFKLKTSNGSLYYGYYDAVTGALAYNYSSISNNTETLGSDIYIYVKDATKAVAGLVDNTKQSCQWSAGMYKLMDLVVDDGKKSNITYFVDSIENKVYTNVRVESLDGELNIGTAYQESGLTIYSSNNEVIATFTWNETSGLVLVTE